MEKRGAVIDRELEPRSSAGARSRASRQQGDEFADPPGDKSPGE
jgi:hypothetical protein